jgi:hypothetical protein
LAARDVVLFGSLGAEFTLPHWHALNVKTLELAAGNPGSTAVTAPDGVYVVRDDTVPKTVACTDAQMPFRVRRSIELDAQANTPGSYIRAGENGFGINCLNGFRSSCTANATAGGGVLVFPDYTRDCRCQFENQTSLALIHTPQAEKWSFDYRPAYMQTKGPITRIGLNCGGPGDRLDDAGTLWLDYPGINGPAGPAGDYVNTSAGSAERLRCHPSRISGDGIAWVLSSALIGEEKIKIPLGGLGQYTVRLYFAELVPQARPGDRVFDLTIQGRKVLSGLDVVSETRTPYVGLIKEFRNVTIDGDLEIGLVPKAGKTLINGVEAFASGKKGTSNAP